ncbi:MULTISPECIES: competence protein CoiA family protein [Streptomyces]|uniref:Competence protein CoiA family protein n=2 Tax=Streptomyces TaxID=1883 RepID=A0ABV9IN42_9ACTN
MAFRAVHASWGTVFAHLPDLGCGQAWGAVWKVKPPAPITCVECRHPMYAKTSRAGMRFFAHAPHAPDCEIAREGESEAHHLLKLELAWAARDADAHAELEVRAPDGSWRADVLASAPNGSWRIALEAQLSPITDTDIAARAERMRQHGVAACWFSDRPRPPWLGAVPSVRVARVAGGSPLVVVEGLIRFDGRSWRRGGPSTLPDFLRRVFHGQAVPHTVHSLPMRTMFSSPRSRSSVGRTPVSPAGTWLAALPRGYLLPPAQTCAHFDRSCVAGREEHDPVVVLGVVQHLAVERE